MMVAVDFDGYYNARKCFMCDAAMVKVLRDGDLVCAVNCGAHMFHDGTNNEHPVRGVFLCGDMGPWWFDWPDGKPLTTRYTNEGRELLEPVYYEGHLVERLKKLRAFL